MKHTIAVCLLVWLISIVFMPCQAFSLTDEEYDVLIKTSLEFKDAEAELNNVWKTLMKQVSGDQKKKIIEEQRQWVITGRDAEARKKAIFEDLGLIDAYAQVTRQRAALLKEFVGQSPKTSIEGSYSSGMGILRVKTESGNRLRIDLTTDWPNQNCSGEIKGAVLQLNGNKATFKDADCAGLILTFSGDRVDIEEIDPCGYHGANCRFDGEYDRVAQ